MFVTSLRNDEFVRISNNDNTISSIEVMVRPSQYPGRIDLIIKDDTKQFSFFKNIKKYNKKNELIELDDSEYIRCTDFCSLENFNEIVRFDVEFEWEPSWSGVLTVRDVKKRNSDIKKIYRLKRV